jgi:ribosome-binding protein aMBF1 (putative translation factor)
MEQNQKSMDMEAAGGESAGKAGSAQNGAKPDKRAQKRASRVSSRSANKTVQSAASKQPSKQKSRAKPPNGVRAARIERMMSKAELARRAGLSVLTIDRVEKGLESRMDTKRKILEALELSLADRVRVFGEEE